MRRRDFRWLLVLVLAAAAAFRFYGLNWDGLIGAHPDERYLVDVASHLSFPRRLNPFEATPRYSYGHLPVYLLALGRAFARGVDPLLLGRALSASFDLGTVGLTFSLGKRLYGEWAGLLAAAFVALSVAHVQQAHFFTPDSLLAFFVVAALVSAVRFVQEEQTRYACLAGAAAGVAVGAKATAGLLVIPLGLACFSAPSSSFEDRRSAALLSALAMMLSFSFVDPFAVIDLRTFLTNLSRQAAILRGARDVPYTRQYHRTLPYLYPVVQQLRWGMGWLAGAAGFGGLVYAAWQAFREQGRDEVWILLAWVLPYFAFVGALYAKFPRYLLPILPVLAICAAHWISRLAKQRPLFFPALSALVLGSMLIRCLALAAMYGAPHPWLTASGWLREHVEPGSTIAVEEWDHPLPLDAADYRIRVLPIFDEESPEKWERMETVLEEADYVVIASRRGYATLARWPERYGQTSRYYRHLFEGELAFDPAVCLARYPHVGSLLLVDDPTAGLPFSLPDSCEPSSRLSWRLGRLDESYVVYDHPRVVVFEAVR